MQTGHRPCLAPASLMCAGFAIGICVAGSICNYFHGRPASMAVLAALGVVAAFQARESLASLRERFRQG